MHPRNGTWIVFLLAWFGLSEPVWTQTRSIRFDRLSLEEGLSQNTVNCILQDRVGFLWVGTQEGLNRYDGHEFRIYKNDPEDATTLPANWVNDLLEDPSGDLWIGTEGGLARWRRADDSFVRFRHDDADPGSLSGDRVRVVHRDRMGELWIGTLASGLNRFDPESGSFERFRHDPEHPRSLSDNRIRAIHEDRIGNLWIGTLGGLDRLDRTTPQPVSPAAIAAPPTAASRSRAFLSFRHDPQDPASLSDDGVLSILEDHTGVLWIGTTRGLNRWERSGTGFIRYLSHPEDPSSLAQNRVRALFEDSERRLWVGTEGGLHLLQSPTGRFTRYRHDSADPGSLSADRVMTIYQDRSDLLWIGTQGGGLNRWNPATWAFSHYKTDPSGANSLSNDAVFGFSEDSSGKLWIATLGGLNAFDRDSGTFEHYRHQPSDPGSLADDRLSALLSDRRGALWIGTLQDGLSRLQRSTGGPVGSRFQHFRHSRDAGSLSHNAVSSLFEDRQGTVWIGTFGGGINRWDGPGSDSFTHFRHHPDEPTSLASDRATSFVEGEDGDLWIGTYDAGLERFDRASETFAHLRHDPDRASSLSNDAVMSLHLAPGGVLWVGTNIGLNRLVAFDSFGQALFRRYFERDGLPNNVVWGIYSDDRGRLWMSTGGGISRFDPETETFSNYNASHGLQSVEFNFGAHHQSRDGELFFGGINGFNAFFPDQIESNETVPPLVLTGFSKLNRPVELGRPVTDLDRIVLSHRDYFFSVDFAALDFTAPQENRYRYKLEGFDDDWIDHGNSRRVTFTNLDPGRYTLRVQGSNNDQIWNREGIALGIVITPPFWRTWWFQLLGALSAASAILVAHHIRTASIRHSADRLQRLVKDRTHKLEETQELLLRKERLAVLGELAGSVAHELRNPLGVIKNSIYFLRLTNKLRDEKAREHLGLIEEQVERSNRIIGELLDYARNPTAELRRVDLREIVQRMLDLAKPPAEIKLEARLDSQPVVAEVDPGQVEQILVNFVHNAFEAMPEGGALEIVCHRRGDEAVIALTDTGVGVPEESLTKIFEPLYSSKVTGIGLGLTLSNRYAQLNGGHIECESKLGRGATFRLVLPRVAVEPANESPPAADAAVTGLAQGA